VVASKEEGANIANYLSYREGALGIKYFGILVNTCKMYTAELMYVGLKVEKDYQLGKGCLCPRGGGGGNNFSRKQPQFLAKLHTGGILSPRGGTPQDGFSKG
jgi:hypothetical protein